LAISIQLDLGLTRAFSPGQHVPCGKIEKAAAVLEKLQETPWFTLMHDRTENGAHRNLTEIKAFAL
jgi:hypothetical protein